MKIKFCCPKCEVTLKENEEIMECEKCKNKILKNENFYDLSNKNTNENISNKKIQHLLECVNELRYENGIKEFIKKFPKEKQYLVNTKFDQSIDSIFHCMNKNYKNCLVIGNDYGNIAEILSKIFPSVYLLDFDNDKNKFHKIRIQNNELKNIITVKVDKDSLPFENDSFDLIIINNKILNEEFEKNQSKNNNSKYLKKIKEILTDGGCLCLSVKNRFGAEFLSDKKREKSQNQTDFKFSEYMRLLQQLDFKIKPFWGLPSEERPYYSAQIDDNISLKWYFGNFSSFMKGTKIKIRHKLSFFLLKNAPNFLSKLLVENFIPFFILCCYKNKISESIEDEICNQTNQKFCLMLSRRIKIVFIVFDNFGKPKFIVNWKRYGNKIPDKIKIHKREFSCMGNPKEQVWMEQWKEGKTLNPFNYSEVIGAINWLTSFQKNTIDDDFSLDNLTDEFQLINSVLENDKSLDNIKYKKWLNEYKEFINNHDIKKSSVHGDFWYANMLYDKNLNKVHLVDWENYKKIGNPFHDLSIFIMRWMMMSENNQIETFRKNLVDNKKFTELLNEVKKMINQHFEFDVNLDILLRYIILRNVSKLSEIKNSTYYKYLKMLEILEKHRLN